MEHLWIWLAVLGAALQAIRTAAQRDLNRHLSTLATTYVRSLFGLPLLAVYLAAITALTGEGLPTFGVSWLAYTLIGAMVQVVATALLIRMFTLRSFGVGTMLTKVDIVITAILGGLVLFRDAFGGRRRSAAGGDCRRRADVARAHRQDGSIAPPIRDGGFGSWVWAALTDKSIGVALGCAFTFSISFLTYREAALVIGEGSFLWRGAWTVLLAILMQTVIVGAWLAWREPGLRARLAPHVRLSTFIGATSAVGSICWFTAFALQNASYVRAVGQVEVVFTLLVSALYYRERISALEYGGIALTVAGVLMFRLAV